MLYEKIQLENDEQIIDTVHKHWFVFFTHTLSIILVAIAPLVGWIVVSTLAQSHDSTLQVDLSAYTLYFLYFYCIWLLINWMALAHMWTTHHLDVWVITDRRIIAIEQVSLFRRQIGSFRLEKLQDISIEVDGILATFLDFGSLEAQTASGSHGDEFRTNYLPNPRELKAVILKAADNRMNSQNNSERNGD